MLIGNFGEEGVTLLMRCSKDVDQAKHAEIMYSFVLGTGRTATSFLTSYFNANVQKGLITHEPDKIIKILSNMHISGKVGKQALLRYLRYYSSRVARWVERDQKAVYIQIDPWLCGFAPLLKTIFNECRIAHIVRHPLTYIPSHLNRFYREQWVGSLRDVIPFWRLRGDVAGEYSRRDWKQASQEVKMAWNWRKVNQFIQDNCESYPNYTRIRYEDLFDDKNSGFKNLCEHFGIDQNTRFQDASHISKNSAPPKFLLADRWSGETRQQVLDLCRPLMERYGYTE